MTDPISDLLARIRNALHAHHEQVAVPHSTLKLEIVRILYEEGYISGYKLVEGAVGKDKMIEVALKYLKNKSSVISMMRRFSRPGLRTYRGYRDLRPVRSGMGLVIISTPKGVLTDVQARAQKVGGEPLCTIW
mgnify:CR=1 FL=1